MSYELYDELRQLTVTCPPGDGLRRSACPLCEKRWAKIKDVADRMVEQAEIIRAQKALDKEAMQRVIERLEARPRRLPPRKV